MHNIPFVENNMFNTLVFSKKMQSVGLSQAVSEELASTLFNLHVNQFENLFNKSDFGKFEIEIKKEMENFVTKTDFGKFEIEIKNDIDGVKNDFSKFEIEIKKDIDGVKKDIDGVKKDIDGVKKDIDSVKNEFSKFEIEIKKDIDGVKKDIDGVKNEFSKFEIEIKKNLENFITKKEFYAETKNLSLSITIKLGVIMVAGVGALALLIKL